MRIRSLILLCALAAAVWSQTRNSGPALEGNDPVLLTEGKDVEGLESLTVQHGRFLYRFASAETRDRFNKDPERYSIQLDGACARMGPPVTGDQNAYLVYNGRIYIMGTQECYRHFKADATRFLESEQPKILWNPSADARAKGRATLAKALAAMGGPNKFQGVTSYVENRVSQNSRGDKQQIAHFGVKGGEFGTETTFAQGSAGNIVLKSGAYGVFRGEGRHVPESFAAQLRKDWLHELIPILLAAAAPGADAFASGEEGGATLVAIRIDGNVSMLHIDPASGLVQALSYRGRGVESAFGDLKIAFSDYRESAGFKLPYRTELSFNGAPFPGRGWTIESYEFNPPNIAARLKAPEKIRE